MDFDFANSTNNIFENDLNPAKPSIFTLSFENESAGIQDQTDSLTTFNHFSESVEQSSTNNLHHQSTNLTTNAFDDLFRDLCSMDSKMSTNLKPDLNEHLSASSFDQPWGYLLTTQADQASNNLFDNPFTLDKDFVDQSYFNNQNPTNYIIENSSLKNLNPEEKQNTNYFDEEFNFDFESQHKKDPVSQKTNMNSPIFQKEGCYESFGNTPTNVFLEETFHQTTNIDDPMSYFSFDNHSSTNPLQELDTKVPSRETFSFDFAPLVQKDNFNVSSDQKETLDSSKFGLEFDQMKEISNTEFGFLNLNLPEQPNPLSGWYF